MKLMKTAILSTLAISLAAVAATGKIKAGKYDIDTAHTKVGFSIAHMVISSVDGRFGKFEGKLELNDKFEKSNVEASVDIASVDTGNSKRDDHLKSPDFFDAAKFPKMTFKSKKITGTPEKFKLEGDLTIKGVTKPVTFDGKFAGSINDGFGNERAAFVATAEIKRADFGLTWSKMVEAGPVVGDNLTIDLKVEAVQPLAKK